MEVHIRLIWPIFNHFKKGYELNPNQLDWKGYAVLLSNFNFTSIYANKSGTKIIPVGFILNGSPLRMKSESNQNSCQKNPISLAFFSLLLTSGVQSPVSSSIRVPWLDMRRKNWIAYSTLPPFPRQPSSIEKTVEILTTRDESNGSTDWNCIVILSWRYD